jgi:hypothetical protein
VADVKTFKVYGKSIWTDSWGPPRAEFPNSMHATDAAYNLFNSEGWYTKVEVEEEGKPTQLVFLDYHGKFEAEALRLGYERVCVLAGMGEKGPGK